MVITSALAKRPEDRFQSAGELWEALAAAAEGKMPQQVVSAASTNPAASSSETNRIVVPTGSNEAPRGTSENELDEETVIRARPAAVAYESEGLRTRASEPPPQKSGPWRIVIPALAGLLVLFGVIYAITYSGNPAQPSSNQTPGMSPDANSKPVQAAPPPTGNAEAGVAPSANSNNSNNTNAPGTIAGGADTKPPENKNAEGGTSPENTNTGTANRRDRGKRDDNQGEQNNNQAPRNDNQDQGEEPPPPPPGSNSDTPSDKPKPKPKKVEPGLPAPPPTSNISDQEQ
jgi:hypothetical protein